MQLYLDRAISNEEKEKVWTANSAHWGKALSKADYIGREYSAETWPLAETGSPKPGRNCWVLTNKTGKEANQSGRTIYAFCDTLRKEAYTARNGEIRKAMTHCIGSVFTMPGYEGNGYARIMLTQLAFQLPHLDLEPETPESNPFRTSCPFSILYSDIGLKYYSKIGWHPYTSKHIELTPDFDVAAAAPRLARGVSSIPDEALGKDRENLVQELVQSSLKDSKQHVAVIPSRDLLKWHEERENYMTEKLFGKRPEIRGALAGSSGARVWAKFARSYYGPLGEPASENTFHILRLGIEDLSHEDNTVALKEILQIALQEARKWKCEHVEMWNPSPAVLKLVEATQLPFKLVDRQTGSIPSLMWHSEGENSPEKIEWHANEKFGWS